MRLISTTVIFIDRIASRLNLRSKSKNLENGDRYLIIHKKLNLNHLANDILNDGPYAEFYELIAPKRLIVTITSKMNQMKPKYLIRFFLCFQESKGPKAKKRNRK